MLKDSTDGTVMIKTQVIDPRSWTGTAGLATAAMTASTIAFAKQTGWNVRLYDVEDLERSAEKVQADD